MVTGGGGGKAGYQDDDEGNDEDCGGRRQGSSTPGPETTAVVPECQRKTGEMRGGSEEVWPGESTCEEDTGSGVVKTTVPKRHRCTSACAPALHACATVDEARRELSTEKILGS